MVDSVDNLSEAPNHKLPPFNCDATFWDPRVDVSLPGNLPASFEKQFREVNFIIAQSIEQRAHFCGNNLVT